jgi:hypothetical protein
MSNQQDSSSKGLVTIIVAFIGVLGTVAVSYFAFRGNVEPKQLEIRATQMAESIRATQIAAAPIQAGLTSSPTDNPVLTPTLYIPLPTVYVPPTISPTVDIPAPTVYVPPLPTVYDLTILANQSWTGTGIRIEMGKNYSITATGEWIGFGDQVPDNANGRQSETCFNSRLPMQNFPCASLIARIGNGNPFFVGDRYEFTATTEGTLFLGPNDSSDGLFDNSGYLNVRIEITVLIN